MLCHQMDAILPFCESVDQYLRAHPKNVVAVHCKAGKGRTGMLIACYLLYAGISPAAEDALLLFGSKRTRNCKGVTLPRCVLIGVVGHTQTRTHRHSCKHALMHTCTHAHAHARSHTHSCKHAHVPLSNVGSHDARARCFGHGDTMPLQPSFQWVRVPVTVPISFHAVPIIRRAGGCSTVSQIRYVHLFDQLLKYGPPDARTYQVTHIRLIGRPDYDMVGAMQPLAWCWQAVFDSDDCDDAPCRHVNTPLALLLDL